MIVLLSSRPASATEGNPYAHQEHKNFFNSVITGVKYDVVNQALAEHRLKYLQAKLKRDTERGATAAVKRDLWHIDYTRYRITMDEWLIRWNSCQHYDFYPIRTGPETRAVIAQVASPSRVPLLQQDVWSPGVMADTPKLTVMIANAGPEGTNLAFDVNGKAHETSGGSRQTLEVPPDSTISYDAGGSLGRQRYSITSGSYEFRSTADGWVLYKLPDTPE